jgi:hypothetical protein
MLWTMNAQGVPAPDGWAYNVAGQLVQLAFQPWQSAPSDRFGSPQPPWESFDNPDYINAMQGRSTVEIQPSNDPTAPPRWGKDPLGRAVPPVTHEHVALVPDTEYMRQEDSDVPSTDYGGLALTGVGISGAPSRTVYRMSKGLISYVEVPSPDEPFALAINDPTQPNPLNVPPVQATIGDPPIGGCVSISQISFGHKGSQFQALYDVPPAQIIHVPFGASYGASTSLLVPKYYTPATEAGTTFRDYLLFPGGPVLTNLLWNTLNQNVLVQNGFTNPNSVPFMGWFALADSFSNTTFSQPNRRFYGSVLCTAAIANPLQSPIANPTQVTVVPVAWFASQVTLVGNPALVFAVRGLTSAGGVTQIWGPFPANQAITLPAGATSILVWAASSLIQPGVPRIDEVFEVVYTLSF